MSKGENFATKVVKKEGGISQLRTWELSSKTTDLTPEMLADGSWQTRSFKQINFDALGAPVQTGSLHPLLKAVHLTMRSVTFRFERSIVKSS